MRVRVWEVKTEDTTHRVVAATLEEAIAERRKQAWGVAMEVVAVRLLCSVDVDELANHELARREVQP